MCCRDDAEDRALREQVSAAWSRSSAYSCIHVAGNNGQHDKGCRVYYVGTFSAQPKDCTCGWDEAKSAAQKALEGQP